jgi:glucuronosyltransferase
MPVETLQAFMSAFAKLPQRVIWKWEADVPVNVPSNIMMKKWLPQQDLLGI